MPSRVVQDGKPEAPTLPHDRPVDSQNNAQRWHYNGSGQLVDASEWDLADDMVQLRIGEDTVGEVHGPMRTPPQSKISAAAVVQLNEASPLESSSDASDSPHSSDHPVDVSHSRGSSLDTSGTQDSNLPSANHNILGPSQPLKVAPAGEVKERPHSFSGGLSSADLRRLQQVGEAASSSAEESHQNWNTLHMDRQYTPESQLTYPSLAQQQSAAIPRSQQQLDHRPLSGNVQRDDPQVDYANQPRNFNQTQHHSGLATTGAPPPPPTFIPGRPVNGGPAIAYR